PVVDRLHPQPAAGVRLLSGAVFERRRFVATAATTAALRRRRGGASVVVSGVDRVLWTRRDERERRGDVARVPLGVLPGSADGRARTPLVRWRGILDEFGPTRRRRVPVVR